MKKIIAAAVLAATTLPLSAQAGELIIGAKAGLHKADVSGFDPAPMISAQLSYEFLDLVAADFAIELEAGKTLSDGEVDNSTLKDDFSVTTIGAYISARTAGPVYAIGRLGIVKTEIDFDSIPSATDTDENGIAVGAGVGFSLGVRTEVELTRYDIDDEQAFYLSLGVAF